MLWRVLASSISICAKFAKVLPAEMASNFFLERVWLESVAMKIPRMHTGLWC